MTGGESVGGTVLVTPDTTFELQVKRAFDGELEAKRCWDDQLAWADPETSLAEIARCGPDLVVIGPGVPAVVGLALAEAFAVLRPEIGVVLVARPTPHLWAQALQAGVREIISVGADDDEIREVLGRARGSADRRRTQAPSEVRHDGSRRGRVITVLSPKGGCGKTTVAINLAVTLAALGPGKAGPGRAGTGKVALVDLDLQFGDVATGLGIGPQSTIADAARAGAHLDATNLKVLLERHSSGVYALVGPHFPAEADEIAATTADHILDLLASEFDYVVADTSAGLDEFTLSAAERSTDLVLVCMNDVPSVRGLRKAIDVLDLLGMTKPRRHLVLNHSDDRVGLTARDIEATLGMPIGTSVPTSRSIQISINQGSPVVDSDSRSAAARAFAELGQRFAPLPTPESGARRLARKDRR